MKISTVLLLSASVLGAIAFNPTTASADVNWNLNVSNRGNDSYVRTPPPAIVPPAYEHSSNWRFREQERFREAQRVAELRARELREREQRERQQREYAQREREFRGQGHLIGNADRNIRSNNNNSNSYNRGRY